MVTTSWNDATKASVMVLVYIQEHYLEYSRNFYFMRPMYWYLKLAVTHHPL